MGLSRNGLAVAVEPGNRTSLARGDGRNMMPWNSLLSLLAAVLSLAPLAGRAAGPPSRIEAYQPFFVHYAPSAEGLWHESGGRGYWGDGLAGGNGGIRGTSNLTLVMAWLVYASDRGWLSGEQQAGLARAGLDRDTCLRRVRQSWRYLADCHIDDQSGERFHPRQSRVLSPFVCQGLGPGTGRGLGDAGPG